MVIAVREATEADLPEILLIYRDAGLDGRRSLTLGEAGVLWRKFAAYPRYKLYLACADGRIAGTFALLIMDNLAGGGFPSGIVEDVAVARAMQGRGIGRAMMTWALEECKRQGCYKMLLSSNEMRTGAHAFYESLGFVRHGFSFRVEMDPEGDR